jgi:hypothetical protein
MNQIMLPSSSSIHNHDSAVIDLPMYLVITLIIGLVALGSILSMIVLPSFFAPTPQISADPLVAIINSSDASINYHIHVTSVENSPIEDAHVIIKNTNVIATNKTNTSGWTTVSVQPKIPSGLHETYFDVIVKSPSYQQVTYNHMLKVILRS